MSRWRFEAAFIAFVVSGAVGCVDQISSLSLKGTSKTPVPGVSLQPSTSLSGPIFGQIVDQAGAPAPNVPVRAFLSDTTPLVGNSGAGLAGNSGGAYRLLSLDAIRLAAGIEEKTDGFGRFVLRPERQGSYNLEAVLNDSLKAWKGAVRYSGADTNAGNLQLAPVGQITGRVKASSDSATDLSGVTVYIPGSSYIAITTSAGLFTISNVPVGAFDLGAFHVDLGDAKLADTDSPSPVEVQSSKTATSPILTLKFNPPEVSRITRVGKPDSTDNAAAGQAIEIRGNYFGLSRGAKATVEFSGANQVPLDRLSDTLAKVTVPPDAKNGRVSVIVSGRLSNPVTFRVLKRFDLSTQSLSLTRGATMDLAPLISAFDTDDIRIAESATAKTDRPYIEWSTDNNRAGVSDRGIIEAISEGAVTVTGKAGTLPPRSLALTVSHSGSSTPTPGTTPPPATPFPSPSSSNTPSPVASLSPTPTSAPSPTTPPTPTPTSAPSQNPSIPPSSTQVTTLAGDGVESFADGPGNVARFRNPFGVAVDRSGTVYVGDYGNSRLRKISPSGVVSTLAGNGTGGAADGQGTEASFWNPKGVAVSESGTVYVADGQRIRKVTSSGVVTTLAGKYETQGFADGIGDKALFNQPMSVAVDASGIVYVADLNNGRIRKITPDGLVSTLAAQFNLPAGVAVDSSGTLFVADSESNRILKVTSSGVVSTLAGDGTSGFADGLGSAARFKQPRGVAVDDSGTVYVADRLNFRIRKIKPSGEVTTLAGDGSVGLVDGPGIAASFTDNYQLAVSGSGTVYLAEFASNVIRVIRQ